MTAQDLKNSILQLAVQGKLVKQDPNDEPASELLKRIRAEKQRLVKEGKIKKDKNPSEIFIGSDKLPYEKRGEEIRCIDDEIPFDIPDSWAWCRLGEIVAFRIGKTPPRKDPLYWDNPIYPWVSIADMKADSVIYETNEQINEFAYSNVFSRRISYKGTLLMSFKLTVGRVSILGIDAFHNEAIVSIFPYIAEEGITKWYLFNVLPLITKWGNSKDAIKGTTLNSDSLYNLLIPLPPLNEQKRIVEKIEELLPYVEAYRKCETELTTLNKNFPDALKKSILQWAVQGKLVDQDPNDEPADILLEKIRAEKEKLIKEGKIKRDKNASKIIRRGNEFYEKFPDGTETLLTDLPFDIPDSWTWCRLSDIAHSLPQKKPTKNFSYIDVGSIDNKRGCLSEVENIINPVDAPVRARKIVEAGCIIYSTVRPYLLNTAIIEKTFQAEPIASTAFAVIKPFNGIEINYLHFIFRSQFFIDYINSQMIGVAYPAISEKNFWNALIPLSPLKEQLRVYKKICLLYKVIDLQK